MLFWILMATIETLLFLKVIESFTPVVTMMISVIGNLWDFMVFYFICLLFLGIVFPVFGLDKNEEYHKARTKAKSSGDGRGFAGYEYQELFEILKYFVMVLRISVGDYDFGYLSTLDLEMTLIFWILWIIIVVATSVIMLNFVIAKACDCYQAVADRLDEFILKGRAGLITEADLMTPDRSKNFNNYPKYLVVRQSDD